MTLDPFDRTRPLWQFTVIEGLPDGQAALFTKMHHTITDGINGVRMSMEYLDLDRDGAHADVERSPTCRPSSNRRQRRHAADALSAFATMRSVVEGSFRLPLAIAKEVRGLLADPVSIPKASAGRRRNRAAGCSHSSRTSTPARSPLWTNRSMHRTLRNRANEVRADQGCRQAPRREHQRRVPHRRRRGGIALPRRARRTDAGAARVDGHQHPHRGLRRECVLGRADARADRGDADRQALRARRRHCRSRRARRPDPARWRPSRRSRPRCRRR